MRRAICAASVTRLVSVLGTRATVSREYTHALIRDFANGAGITLVGSARLAGFAEAELNGTPVEDRLIVEEIAPCFVNDGGRRTDTIVLACTHYPLLLERFEALAPWRVTFIDPAPAIARRVVELLGPHNGSGTPSRAQIMFTSGKAPSPALGALPDVNRACALPTGCPWTGPISSTTRRATAGAGSTKATGHGARPVNRSSSRG